MGNHFHVLECDTVQMKLQFIGGVQYVSSLWCFMRDDWCGFSDFSYTVIDVFHQRCVLNYYHSNYLMNRFHSHMLENSYLEYIIIWTNKHFHYIGVFSDWDFLRLGFSPLGFSPLGFSPSTFLTTFLSHNLFLTTSFWQPFLNIPLLITSSYTRNL